MLGFTVLCDDGNLCGEAPLWDEVEQKLYWTDCIARRFYSYDWSTRTREIAIDNFEVNGCALDQSGGLVFSNSSGVWFWNKKSVPVHLVSDIEGTKLQLNDCVADQEGRLLAGSTFYDHSGEYPLGKLFCVQTDGTVCILDEGFHLANGLGFSPDGKTLYFVDSVTRVIYAYEYDLVKGTAGNRRTFVKVGTDSGLPDGLTVDAEGFVCRPSGTVVAFRATTQTAN